MRGAIAFLLLLALVERGYGQEDHIFVYVDGSATGPAPGTGTAQDPFHTITAALNYAWQHDFVLVRPGVYHEQITIPFFVFLHATDGPELTTIDATGFPGSHAVTMEPLTELIGFTIRKNDGGGVLVEVPGAAGGIPEYGRIIRGNRVLGCPDGGLQIIGPAHPFTTDNVIAGCAAFGLKLEDGASPWFASNTVVGCGVGLWKSGAPPDPLALFANTIVWGTQTALVGFLPSEISSSILADPLFAGQNGNLATDPLFLLTDPYDFRLAAGSPGIDTADGTLVVPSSPFDVRGNGFLRRMDGDHDGLLEADRGAYERGGLDATQLGTGVGSTLRLELDLGAGAPWYLAGGTLSPNPAPLAGATGFLFLDPAGLLLLAAGVQPTSAPLVIDIPILGPGALGLTLPIQAAGLPVAPPASLWTLTSAPIVRIR